MGEGATKKCTKCGEVKGVGEFGKRTSSKDGLKWHCRVCVNAARRRWSALNPRKVRAKSHRRRVKNRPMHVTRSTLRNSLTCGRKTSRPFRRLPYNGHQLKAHLATTMPDGYTWDDLPVLQIDHIRPVSSFDSMEPGSAEWDECWALSNLRLLTKDDNEAKGSTWSA